MKTIAFHLQKGGVGKTSLSVSVAYELAKGARTCLVDLDPQGNSSSWLLTVSPPHEVAEVLFGKVSVSDAIVKTPTDSLFLDLLPTFGLDGELKAYGETKIASEPFIFCDLADELAKLGYQYVIFDLSPGMGPLERAALIAANEAITPLTPEEFSLDGISIFSAELEKTKKAMRRGPEYTKIIVNAYSHAIGQHKDIMGRIERQLSNLNRYVIPVDPAFRKAQAQHIPVQSLKKQDAAKPETLAELAKIGEAVCR